MDSRTAMAPERRTAHDRQPGRGAVRSRTRGLAGGCAAAAVAALAAVALTACGSDDSASASDDVVESPPPVESAGGDSAVGQTGDEGMRIVPAAAMTGDCFAELPAVDQSAVEQVELTDCADPHAVEIVDDFTIDDPQASFEHVTPIATEQCTTRARDAVNLRKVDPKMTVFYWGPAPDGWEQGDRGVICGIGLTDGKTSGSVLQDGS